MTIPFLLSRYLIKNFFIWLLATALLFTVIIALFDLVDILRRTSTKLDIPYSIILRLFIYHVPGHLQEVMPFISLLSAIMTFFRLNKYHEITAFKASGISIWQFLAPLLGFSLFLGLLNLTIFSPITADMMSRFKTLEQRYLTERPESVAVSETGLWLRERIANEERLYRVTHVDHDQKILHQVTVFIFNRHHQFVERLDSNMANLQNGALLFQQPWLTRPLETPRQLPQKTLTTTLNFQYIQDSVADPKTLPFWSLQQYGDLMERSGLSGKKYDVQWHLLLTQNLWLAIMILLAATFSLKPMRFGQNSIMLGSGILIAFCLYFFRDILTAMGLAGTLPSMLAVWSPPLLTTIFSATKLLYSEDG